ncbi:serine hydrolase domain-containing protein [Aureibaculum luteum]|uniref:serine hydrolase domain-containing protein n=1 Tax=Aureibaculum luteum TaxID=1548456 RepID=UPI000E4C32D8|nr:serine hydrolase [Aureibaculum luteum]
MNIPVKTIIRTIFFTIITLIAITTTSCAQTNEDKLDALISTYADYGEFNGTALVVEEGKVIYKKGFGLANMEWDIPNQPDTKFRIGSITKQFSAMLIMQLVAEKKLDLHTTISTYLPNYPKENGDKITIHNLLTHSSGIPNSYESTKQKAFRPDNYKLTELVQEFSALPLEFTPGEKFSYCNAGYNLLGLIVETITKKTYEEVLQNKIFTPLKMTNTGFDKHRALQKNRASGYFKSWGDYYNANYVDMSTASAAGALYSTVEDLYRWDQSLYSEKLLTKKYMDLVFTKHIADPNYGGEYGYGWSIKNKLLGNSNSKVETVTHDGTIDGFCAIFTRIPSSKSTVILLSNIRRAPLNAMTKGIMGILYGKTYDFPKKSAAYSLLDGINKKGTTKGIEHYKSIKNNDTYYLSEDEINIVSYKFLQSDRPKIAAEVLKIGIESYPRAFNLYDSYGEVLLSLGDTIKAIKNYKKSIELNPKNEHGIKILKELEINSNELEKVDLNLIKTDSTWGQEIFIFPIHFAPEIKYEGFEDIRFAKGWAKVDSDGFWTYAFAWSVKANSALSEKEIESNLQLYFDGLMTGVNKDKDKILPKTLAQLDKKEDTNNKIIYTGKISIFDAFTTQKKMTLNVHVENYYLERKKKAVVLFRFSPKYFEHDIWNKLNEVKLRDTILKK